MVDELVSLDRDRDAPARGSLQWLKAPFQEVENENLQAARQLALLGLAHALDFLRNVLDVGLRELALAQERRLLIGPGVEIVVVEPARGHLVLAMIDVVAAGVPRKIIVNTRRGNRLESMRTWQ